MELSYFYLLTLKMPEPNYYNHPVWPSPRARLVAIKIGIDKIDGVKIKRLTHAQALVLLAKKCKQTVKQFLETDKAEAHIKLGCWYNPPGKYYSRQAYDPLRFGSPYYRNNSHAHIY